MMTLCNIDLNSSYFKSVDMKGTSETQFIKEGKFKEKITLRNSGKDLE